MMNKDGYKTEGPDVLTVKIEGPEVQSGRIEVEHLSSILKAFQKSVRVAVDHYLKAARQKIVRSDKQAAHKAATLEVISFESGSFSVVLGLPPRPEGLPSTLTDFSGEKAVQAVLHDLRRVAQSNGDFLNRNEMEVATITPFTKIALYS